MSSFINLKFYLLNKINGSPEPVWIPVCTDNVWDLLSLLYNGYWEVLS
jgi:hypothetical protein